MAGTLTHSPASILQYALIEQGVVALPTDSGSWPCYAGDEPDKPDSCVAVLNTAGIEESRDHVTNERAELHGVNIRIRAAKGSTAFTKANAIAVALDGLVQEEVSIGSNQYVIRMVQRLGPPFDLGKENDISNRRIYTIDALIRLRAWD